RPVQGREASAWAISTFESKGRLNRQFQRCKAERRPQRRGVRAGRPNYAARRASGAICGSKRSLSARTDRGDIVVEIAQRGGAGRVGAAGAIIALGTDLHFIATGIVDGRDAIGPAAQVAGGFARIHAETVAPEAGTLVEADFVLDRANDRWA